MIHAAFIVKSSVDGRSSCTDLKPVSDKQSDKSESYCSAAEVRFVSMVGNTQPAASCHDQIFLSMKQSGVQTPAAQIMNSLEGHYVLLLIATGRTGCALHNRKLV
jgi:hypothetical protein